MYAHIVRVMIIVLPWLFSQPLYADGSIIDKVYNPYVQLLEKEIEYRALYSEDSNSLLDGEIRHSLSYGQSLSDRFFAEVYIIGVDEPNGGFSVDAYEVELKWQLSEQGEFSNDWGLFFELERETESNIWEASSAIIAVHEWSRWIATGNFLIIYEWGGGIDNELEAAFSGQLRFRNNELIEPAIELYQSQGSQGIGPVLTGLWRLGGGRKLLWEMGSIFGTDSDTPNVNWKLNLEYEFK